jgi:hypothetical protein
MNRIASVFRVSLLAVGTAFLPTCAHVKADDMSVESHRSEAREHEHDAAAEEAKYNPYASAIEPGASLMQQDPFSSCQFPCTYNPTADHKQMADQHRQRAHQHLRAAAELENFEEKECSGLPKEIRAACPLVSGATTVVIENNRGVRLHMKDTADTEMISKQMRCHLAFARARGYRDEPSCPLYFKGVSVEKVSGENSIDVTGTDGTVAAEIQKQARIVFGTPATGNVPLNVTSKK